MDLKKARKGRTVVQCLPFTVKLLGRRALILRQEPGMLKYLIVVLQDVVDRSCQAKRYRNTVTKHTGVEAFDSIEDTYNKPDAPLGIRARQSSLLPLSTTTQRARID